MKRPTKSTSAGPARTVQSIVAILRGARVPMSSAALASRAIGIVGGSETACFEILHGLLRDEHRVFHRAGTGWRVRAAATGPCVHDGPRAKRSEALPDGFVHSAGPMPGQSGRHTPAGDIFEGRSSGRRLRGFENPVREIVIRQTSRDDIHGLDTGSVLPAQVNQGRWAVWAVEPGGRAAAVVLVEKGRPTAERFEKADSRARPDAGLSAAAVTRLCRTAGRAPWICADRVGAAAHLRRLAQMRSPGGASPDDGVVFGLFQIARVVFCPPRPRSMAALRTRLGIGPAVEDHPLERARSAAECLVGLFEQAPFAGVSDRGLLEAALAAASRAETEPSIDPATLRAIPEEPGTYRFRAEDGSLLYVGKSVDLKHRVASYFAARDEPDARTAAWLPRVRSVEVRTAGSEPEALVLEADAIARERPEGNRQRAVRGRIRGDGKTLVMLLPAGRGPGVDVHLLHAGIARARVRLGPRGGGSARLLDLLRRIYFADTPSGTGSRRPDARAIRRGRLLTSWVSRQIRPVPAFDPTDAPDADAALSIALRYAADMRRGERDAIHRAAATPDPPTPGLRSRRESRGSRCRTRSDP